MQTMVSSVASRTGTIRRCSFATWRTKSIFASHTQLVEHRSEGVDPGAALQGGQPRNSRSGRHRARRVRWSGRRPARQAVNQVEDTDGKDQNERTEKETDVQMQVAGEEIDVASSGTRAAVVGVF